MSLVFIVKLQVLYEIAGDFSNNVHIIKNFGFYCVQPLKVYILIQRINQQSGGKSNYHFIVILMIFWPHYNGID